MTHTNLTMTRLPSESLSPSMIHYVDPPPRRSNCMINTETDPIAVHGALPQQGFAVCGILLLRAKVLL